MNFEPREDVFDLVTLAIDSGIERGRLLRNRLITTTRNGQSGNPCFAVEALIAHKMHSSQSWQQCARGRLIMLVAGSKEHAAEQAPVGSWCTTTMIGAVRLDGTAACMAIEDTTDTDVFRAYVREILCPALRHGDIVVMDNLGAHKNEQTLALVRASGATPLFLPAYSPDLNSIEPERSGDSRRQMMWSKVKALLRKAAARTRESLLEAIADTLHWFTVCGYNFI